MIDAEVQVQIEALRRRVKEAYGEALTWADWLKEQRLTEGSLLEKLSRGVRVMLLKRVLVNAAETQCNSTQLKDRLYEFLSFADVDEKRFKRWVEDVKKSGLYPIVLSPAFEDK
jgi:hypothetical protein